MLLVSFLVIVCLSRAPLALSGPPLLNCTRFYAHNTTHFFSNHSKFECFYLDRPADAQESDTAFSGYAGGLESDVGNLFGFQVSANGLVGYTLLFFLFVILGFVLLYPCIISECYEKLIFKKCFVMYCCCQCNAKKEMELKALKAEDHPDADVCHAPGKTHKKTITIGSEKGGTEDIYFPPLFGDEWRKFAPFYQDEIFHHEWGRKMESKAEVEDFQMAVAMGVSLMGDEDGESKMAEGTTPGSKVEMKPEVRVEPVPDGDADSAASDEPSYVEEVGEDGEVYLVQYLDVEEEEGEGVGDDADEDEDAEAVPVVVEEEEMELRDVTPSSHPEDGSSSVVSKTKTEEDEDPTCAAGLKVADALFHLRIPDVGWIIVIGCVIGAVIRGTGIGDDLRNEMLSFNPNLIMLLLVPPLVLSFGLNIGNRLLVQNIGTILLHGILGTTLVAGFLTLAFRFIVGGRYSTPECFLLGAALSGHNPDVILGFYAQANLNSKLVSIVANEHILNDIAAIVIWSVVSSVGERVHVEKAAGDTFSSSRVAGVVGLAIAKFIIVGLLSALLGTVIGLIAAFVSRFSQRPDARFLQPLIILVFAFLTWFLCDSLYANPVLGMLFAAVVMSKYIRENMCSNSRVTLENLLQILGVINSSLIAVYIGVSIVVDGTEHFDWYLILCANVGIFVLRIIIVWAIDGVINLGLYATKRRASMHPAWEILARCLSGTRGTTAFLLTFIASSKFFPNKLYLLTASISCIVFTTYVQGTMMSLFLYFVPIRRNRISCETMIEKWQRIIRKITKITMILPTIWPPIQPDEYSSAQLELIRGLAFQVNKHHALLCSCVGEFYQMMKKQLDDDVELARRASGKEKANSLVNATLEELQEEDTLSKRLKGPCGPFLQMDPNHKCRMLAIEAEASFLLGELDKYLKTLPAVMLPIVRERMDDKAFRKAIDCYRPVFVEMRSRIAAFVASIIKEHIEHMYWVKDADDQARWEIIGSMRRLWHSLDHLMQQILTRRHTTSEKSFVKEFVEYRVLYYSAHCTSSQCSECRAKANAPKGRQSMKTTKNG